MNINKDVKTLLAKLLATEDISVVHKNMPTAYFDTHKRELGLPILKNMSGDIYDMMTLHEVGHALWTEPENWSKIITFYFKRRKRKLGSGRWKITLVCDVCYLFSLRKDRGCARAVGIEVYGTYRPAPRGT